MPVRETAETVETLSKMGIALGPIVMNGVWPEIRSLGKDPVVMLRDAARRANENLSDEAIGVLATVASTQARRARNQRKSMKTLADDVSLPQIELPYLFTERMARPEVEQLAAILSECVS
jgi:hypothetical protein